MLKTKVFAPRVTFKPERQFEAERGNRGRARIIQCVAIIPVEGKDWLDCNDAIIAEPKSGGLLGPSG